MFQYVMCALQLAIYFMLFLFKITQQAEVWKIDSSAAVSIDRWDPGNIHLNLSSIASTSISAPFLRLLMSKSRSFDAEDNLTCSLQENGKVRF